MDLKLKTVNPINVNIRSNTFETNSSSAHTVILTNSNEYANAEKEINKYIKKIPESKKIYDEFGRIYLPIPRDKFGATYSFGEDFEILINWEEKFAYTLASIYSDAGAIKSLINMIRTKSGVDIAGIYCELSEETDIKKIIGDANDENEFINYKSSPYFDIDEMFHSIILYSESYGYIDHNSRDNLDNCIAAMKRIKKYKNFSDEDLLYEIIFSNKIAIVIDGDSCSTLYTSLVDNILDVNNIEGILNYEYESKIKYKFRSVDYILKNYE